MGHLPLVPPETDDPIVRPVFDRLLRRWGKVLNIYRMLAWSPELVRAWAAFAWALRFELQASRRLRELMVIRIAALLGARYEYQHHLHMAQEEGVTEAQVAALAAWQASELFDAAERAVLALADDLATGPGASPATMATLRATFPPRDCTELLVTGAFYCGVARIINSAGIELEDNHAELRASND